MNENMISKKELLDLTGITYGQLYRWKRKKLIPEDWFVKKSSFTGQETYFPKDKILDRIDKILNLKEERSLDELAETFSPSAFEIYLSYEKTLAHPLFQREVTAMYKPLFSEQLNFGDLLGLLICQEFLQDGRLTADEGSKLIKFLQGALSQLPEKLISLLYLRKLGTGFWVLVETGSLLIVEEDAKEMIQITLQPYVEILKSRSLE